MRKSLLSLLLSALCLLCAIPSFAVPRNLYMYCSSSNGTFFNQAFTYSRNTFTLDIEAPATDMTFVIYNTRCESDNLRELAETENNVYWASEFTTNRCISTGTYNLQRQASYALAVATFRAPEAGFYRFTVTFASGSEDPTLVISRLTVANPTFSPSGSSIPMPSEVTINCATPDARLYYTTNGSDPTTTIGRSYTAPLTITISSNCTVKVLATKEGYANSSIVSKTFTQSTCTTPTFSLAEGNVDRGSQLSIMSTAGTTINYTTDGGETFTSAPSPVILYIDQNTNIKAYATRDGYADSPTATASYTVTRMRYSIRNNFDDSWRYSYMEHLENGNWRIALQVPNDGAEFFVTSEVAEIGFSTLPQGLKYASANFYPTINTSYALSTSATNNLKLNAGYYIFIFNPSTKCITVHRDAHMPLTMADFAGGKCHYFLVGARMGQWHLQPEWEFTGDGTSLSIDGGRFMFPTTFAIARVTSYENYIRQIYQLYSAEAAVTPDGSTTVTGLRAGPTNFDGNSEMEWLPATTNTGSRFGDAGIYYAMWFDYEGGENKIDDATSSIGKWAKTITLNLASVNGAPSHIEFDMSDPDNDSERVFLLAGENIFNVNACNSSADGRKTIMSSRTGGMDGWQEAWIQYDRDGNPYFDANGNYIYQTVYQRTWLKRHPSYFNITVDGRTISYTSDNLTFVEYPYLDDLASDPYRDYYRAFDDHPSRFLLDGSGSGPFAGGNANLGTAYRFNALPENGRRSYFTFDWKCYVIKDVWLKGDFKLWSGMGGTSPDMEGIDATDADPRWNSPFAGPANQSEGPTSLEVSRSSPLKYRCNGYSLIYLNDQSAVDDNYSTLDDLKYYERIIMWYSPTAGINYSYVEFDRRNFLTDIQAYLQPGYSNKLEYSWKVDGLNTPGAITGYSTGQSMHYSVKRYRVSPDGLYEHGIVQDHAATEPNEINSPPTFIKPAPFNGGSITFSDPTPLEPGTYVYEFTNLDTGHSVLSNRVTIYDTSTSPTVTPTPVISQLVTLHDDAIDLLISDEAERARLRTSPTFLTYRKESGLKYYIVNELTDASDNITGAEVIPVDATAARNIFTDPSLFTWSAHFFARGLSKTAYDNKMNSLISRRYISDGVFPTPSVAFVDQGVPQTANPAFVSTFNGEEYYSFIFDRQGSLKADLFDVNLDYVTDSRPHAEAASAPFSPVVPKPFGASYYFTYSRDDEHLHCVGDALADALALRPETAQWIRDNVYYKLKVKSDVRAQEIDVLIPEKDIYPRHFDCHIQFQRPNISAKILAKYNIYYKIAMRTNDNDDRLLDYNGTYYDDHISFGDNHPYEIIIKDVNPNEEIYPIFELTQATYRPNDALDDPDRYLNAEFGSDIHLNVRNNPAVPSPRLRDIGWGVNTEEEGSGYTGYKWMYMGHKGLYTYESYVHHLSSQEIALDRTRHYFLQFQSPGDDYSYYPYLYKQSEYDINSDEWTTPEDDYLYGTWVIRGWSSVDVPVAFISSIFVFYRNPVDMNNPAVTTTNLVRETPAATPAPARAGSGPLLSNIDWTPNEKGEYIYTPSPTDAFAGTYVILRSNEEKFSNSDSGHLTGIEDILGDSDAAPEYFDLQGIRITHPEPGRFYIVRRGRTAEKVLYK